MPNTLTTPAQPPTPSQTRPLRVAVVGAGNRGTHYARFALNHPDRMNIVALADPDPQRTEAMARRHRVDPAMCFTHYTQLADHGDRIDAVINTTMDDLHYASTTALLEAGFDVLLEKPIAGNEAEVRGLIDAAQRTGRTVMICHVLRYAPFYDRIKALIDGGRIGRVMHLHTSEHVSYHHMATAFVRGKWNRAERSNPMILAKCCHDLDLIAWFMDNNPPRRVASFGGLTHFRPEQALDGATDRCLDGCPHETTCVYSARRLYVDRDLWGPYVWDTRTRDEAPSREVKLEQLRTTSPYGRCVWRCDNDVVDHQTVNITFDSGATASHDMICTSARSTRTIHLTGTRGEIVGDLTDGTLLVRASDPAQDDGYTEQRIDIEIDPEDMAAHGGGDDRLIADFVDTLQDRPTAHQRTHIDASLHGHLIAFAAEQSRLEGRTIEIKP